MAEEKNLHLNGNDALGEIILAPEVIEVIVGIAASKVPGVYGMQGSFSENVAAIFDRKAARHTKGVYLKVEEAGLVVDLYLYLEYGTNVPKVALELQEKVKQQVLFMTDIQLAQVNIHVEAVVPEKVVMPDFDDLLGLEDEDEQ
ncbi:Asp23/Gls24 family envelope stress response protein [Enterococcus timonensis]|uniref:Asp23/Gls24 family envelope stress response protein n=1 Tax=Enterococcus timonensis TaxID=1852364 RepID=UPI0008DA5BA6|nr:Asp23/Gls24 family envelope stress response protein [Enterococcus timonensis]